VDQSQVPSRLELRGGWLNSITPNYLPPNVSSSSQPSHVQRFLFGNNPKSQTVFKP
jgi:hypothetical protein